MILRSSFANLMNHFLDYMGGCFGCCSKSIPVIAVDEPSKGLKIQGRTVMKRSLSDDFWSTSTCDGGTGSSSIQSEFVNQGLLLWNQSRLQWVDHKKSENRGKAREPVISWNATYESLLGTSKRFPKPIPLCEMVEFLVDIWEHEGLYD